MFAQLRGTYRLDVVGALWHTVALLGVAGTVSCYSLRCSV
jgi:hypothetical protein